MDDNYQTYLNRVARMTLPESYRSQVQHIQESSKFKAEAGIRQPAPFPGYTLITPPAQEDQENTGFYNQMESYQRSLLELPINPDLIVPLPPRSFHLTLADLIWDDAFIHATQKNPQFVEELNFCLGDVFAQYQQSRTTKTPMSWQMLGLILMPRAIGVGLIPKHESCYNEIIQLRRLIYQNHQLMGLGIEQHYHFIAHITLGYFGEIPAELDRIKFSNLLSELNQQWLLNSPELSIHRAELRKFDNMTHYYRQEDWAKLQF